MNHKISSRKIIEKHPKKLHDRSREAVFTQLSGKPIATPTQWLRIRIMVQRSLCSVHLVGGRPVHREVLRDEDALPVATAVVPVVVLAGVEGEG